MIMATLGFVALGVWQWQAAEQPSIDRQGLQSERVFKVRAGTLKAQTVIPEITTFGRIKSWRRAPLSSPVAGDVIWIADEFRDGARIDAAQTLLRIDPLRAELALADAGNALREAEARQAEAREALSFSAAELAAAETMLELRNRQLGRQQELSRSGSTSQTALDNVRMELVTAEQALAARRLSLVRAENELVYSQLAIETARIARDRARRDVEDTTVKAPFGGVLGQVDAALGREVNAGAALAELIDLSALEVEFDLTAAELSRLLDDQGRLLRQPVSVSQQSGGLELKAQGQLLRSGAEVAQSGSGRVAFAGLDEPRATPFRPGDFVTVKIEEPALVNVAVVPAAALDDQGRLLTINADNRLEDLETQIVGQLGDQVILRGAPTGVLFVQARLPQLSAGVKVELAQDPAVEGISSLDTEATGSNAVNTNGS